MRSHSHGESAAYGMADLADGEVTDEGTTTSTLGTTSRTYQGWWLGG